MTNNTIDVSVVVPARDEANTIGELVATLSKNPLLKEIIVVDDGSVDGTATIAAANGARVVSHKKALGNGAAVKSGLKNATTEHVIIVDADGQHTIDDVNGLLKFSTDVDLVVGARPFTWLRFRDFGNLILSNTASLLCSVHIPDLTSGLRRINRSKAMTYEPLYPNGFSFPSTSTILFITSSFQVDFFPISNRPRPAHASKSKLRPFRDGFKFLSIIHRIILMSYPLRFFLPIGGLCLAFGIIWVIKTMYFTSQVSAAGALSILTGLTLCLFGVIADQLSQIRRALARMQ